MKQHAITLAHGTYTELKDTEGAKGTEDKLLWLDIQGTSEELTHFLKERQIPPFLRRRVLSSQRFPSVFSGNDYVLLSVPARKTWVQKRSVSITFILFAQEVITLCRDEGYNFDGEGDTASIRSASDMLIALLDSLVETNICNFIEARSQTENLSLHVDNASGKISEQTILDTRRQINHLVNQFEDFFYGLADLHALTPHAMLSDAVREKLRDIRDAQNHLAKNALRLVTRAFRAAPALPVRTPAANRPTPAPAHGPLRDLHAAHADHRRLWDEFRLYARNGLAIRLLCNAGGHGLARHFPVDYPQTERLVPVRPAGGIRPRSRLRLTRDIAEINVKQRPA